MVVLPYREIDQSGVLYTALAFGRPLVVSRVGGLPELADRHGAAIAFPAGDEAALAGALAGLIADPGERERLAAAASSRGRLRSTRGTPWRSSTSTCTASSARV